ncbi:MAG: Uncharacterised protein [Cryomorphaceae bacterium]|nr:MAG: Uncharacterised protein [Cryomorphaceae bacterium]
MRTLLLAASLLLSSFSAYAQHEITGQWFNQEKTSKLEVYEQDGRYFGKIIWLERTTNSDGSSPRTDEFHPNAEQRTTPLMDMVILKDLTWNEKDQQWQNGIIYDPEVGKTYDCYCELQKDGSLYFKGYVLGLTWLGRSTIWTRK